MPRPTNAETAGKLLSEEWRVVTDFPCYAISSMGRLKRIVSARGAAAGKIWRIDAVNRDGYFGVRLRLNGRERSCGIHQLVAEAFLGPKPFAKAEVRHYDGNKTHNVVTNLRWGSRSDNSHDRHRHGAMPVGEKHWSSRFSDTDIERMRDMRRSGAVVPEIARLFGVEKHFSYFYRICNGRARRHMGAA